MTYYRALFKGSYSTGEAWQTGFGIEDTGLSSTEDVADDIKTSFDAKDDWLRSNLLTSDNLGTLTVYRLPSPLGTPASEVAERQIGGQGTATGNGMPTQVCAVASLRSGFPGRSKRGRMYLPFRGVGRYTAPGLISTTGQTVTASSLAAFFTGFNNSLSGRRVVILSTVMNTAYNVVSVDVGNVPDTQRRRQNALTEVRVSNTVSAV